MNDFPAICILSAGAPIAGVRKCAEVNATAFGQPFEIERATAPVLDERVTSGMAGADIIVAPLIAMQEYASAGLVGLESVITIGSVTIGVVVRDGASEPDLSSVEAFTRAVLAADGLVYNVASSGQYVAATLDKLGLTDKIATKTTVVANGAAVMERLSGNAPGDATDNTTDNATGDEIGFGHITEICRHDHLGTHLVGALPKAIGRETPYAVGLLASASRPDAARALLDFMSSAAGKKIFVANGIL